MGIGPIELQGSIQRLQDFSTVKQNEDNKGMVDQSNFQTHFEKEVNAKSEQVNQKEKSDRQEKKFDASEKGANEYYGNNKRKKKEPEQPSGRFYRKDQPSGGFDIKI